MKDAKNEQGHDYDADIAILHDIENRLEHINTIIDKDWETIVTTRIPPITDDETYTRLQEQVKKTWGAALKASFITKQIFLRCIEINKNVYLMSLYAHPEFKDFVEGLDKKKEIVSELNEMLRLHGAALQDPELEDRVPHILVVVTSRDGKGRYAYEDRVTKKRRGAYKSIREMLPLYWIEDKPREGPSKPNTKHLSEPLPTKKKSTKSK